MSSASPQNENFGIFENKKAAIHCLVPIVSFPLLLVAKWGLIAVKYGVSMAAAAYLNNTVTMACKTSPIGAEATACAIETLNQKEYSCLTRLAFGKSPHPTIKSDGSEQTVWLKTVCTPGRGLTFSEQNTSPTP
ncbi:MAG: hypothetical protein AB7E52_04495 [Bdellovibrionales bacterium]